MGISTRTVEPRSYGLRGRVVRRAEFLVSHEPFLDRIDDCRERWNEAFSKYAVSGSGAPNYHDPDAALHFPPSLQTAITQAQDETSLLECMVAGSAWQQMVRSVGTEFWPIEDFSRNHLLDMTAGFITTCLVYRPRKNLAKLISREVLTLRQSWWDPFDLTWAIYRTFAELTQALEIFDADVPREVLEQIRESMIFRLGEEELRHAYRPLGSVRHGSFRYMPIPEEFLEKDWDVIRSQMDRQWPAQDEFLRRRIKELVQQGLTYTDVAGRLGITDVYVGRLIGDQE